MYIKVYMIHLLLKPQISGMEVNSIPPVMLCNRPLSLYIYILLLLTALVLVIKASSIKRLSPYWKHLFLISIISVMVIDMSMLNLHAMRFSYYMRNLSGKTLNKARSLIVRDGIYEFARFCQREIQDPQVIKLFAPDEQTIHKTLAYHLYPLDARKKTHVDEVEYIIVFDSIPNLTREEVLKFQPIARYSKTRFILKRVTR